MLSLNRNVNTSFLSYSSTGTAVNYPGVRGNSTALVVTWDRPSCDKGVISGYELCYIQTNLVGDCVSNGTIVTITGPDILWYTINDLSINTNYSVEVRGRIGAGVGDPVIDMNSTDEDGMMLLYAFQCCMVNIIMWLKPFQS